MNTPAMLAISPSACERGRSALPFTPEQEASLPPEIARRLCLDFQSATEANLRATLEHLGLGLWRQQHQQRQYDGRLEQCHDKQLRLCRWHGL